MAEGNDNPTGAKVEHDKSATANQQDYRATAVVDGKQLTLIFSTNAGGIKGDKNSYLQISDLPSSYHFTHIPVIYTADIGKSSDYLSTPSKDGTARHGMVNGVLDIVSDKLENKGRRAFAAQAPAMVAEVEKAMFGKDSPGLVTPEEFRKIRNTFQQLEAAPNNATNAVLPTPARDTPHK